MAAVTVVVLATLWLRIDFRWLVLFVPVFALLVGALAMFIMPNRGGQRVLVGPAPPRPDYALVPDPLVARLCELDLLAEELHAANTRGFPPDPDLMLRVQDWLVDFDELDARERAWLRSRGADPSRVRDRFERWLAAEREGSSALAVWDLLGAIAAFRGACLGRATHASEPADAPVDRDSLLLFWTVACLGLWGLFLVTLVELPFTLEPGLWGGRHATTPHLVVGAALGTLPLVTRVLGFACEATAWLRLREALRGGRAQTEVDRAQLLVTLEGLGGTLWLGVLVVASGLLFAHFVAESSSWRSDDFYFAVIAPSLTLLAAAALRRVLAFLELRWLRFRAGWLLWFAAARGRDSADLRGLLLAVMVLGPRLHRASPVEQSEQLETLAAQLLAARRLPPRVRAELRAAGFEPGPTLAMLRRGLDHGGLLSRREVHELRAHFRGLERSLWAAQGA